MRLKSQTILALFYTFFGCTEAILKCYKGFSGDGRAFKERLCQSDFCLKTTERDGGANYRCDDFTPYCTREECVKTSAQTEICCCNSNLCNSAPLTYSTTLALILLPIFLIFHRN